MNQQVFETKLFEMFPDVQSSGVVSRQQIMSTMDALGTAKYPTWLMNNKVGRGLYAIAGGGAVVGVLLGAGVFIGGRIHLGVCQPVWLKKRRTAPLSPSRQLTGTMVMFSRKIPPPPTLPCWLLLGPRRCTHSVRSLP